MTLTEASKKSVKPLNKGKGDPLCASFARKEKNRYERKGYGLIVAIIIALTFFLGIPELGRRAWPSVLAWQEENQLSYTALLLIVALSLHNGIQLVANLIYWAFYHFEFSFIERYKSNDLSWPWYDDPEKWNKLVKKSIAVLLFNANVLPTAVYLLLDRYELLDQHSTAVEDLPSATTLALTITFCMIVEDFTFYWMHRFLHLRQIYPYIHKMHHAHACTVGIAAEYAHPVEFVLGNMLPTSAGPWLLGGNVHLLTVFAWYMIRFGETLDGHCGYEFSWSPYRLIPFSGSAEYHDFHHSANVGNYASFFSIWDTVFGTNDTFYEHIKEREQEVKKAVKSD